MGVRNIIQSIAHDVLNFGNPCEGTTPKSETTASFGCHGNPTKPREKAATPNVAPSAPSNTHPFVTTFQDLCTGPFIPHDNIARDRYETTDDYEKQRDKILYQYCTSRYRHGDPKRDTKIVFGQKIKSDPFILMDGLFDRVIRKYPSLSDIRYTNVSNDGSTRQLVARLSKETRFKAQLSDHIGETITLPEGSLVKLDQEGKLIEATVFEALDIPLAAGSIYLSANSLIHFEIGSFATGLLASGQTYRGYPLKGEELVRWHLEGARKADLRNAVLSENYGKCRHGKKIATAWKTDRMFKRGRLLKCHEAKSSALYYDLELENTKTEGNSTRGYIAVKKGIKPPVRNGVMLKDMDEVVIDTRSETLLSVTPIDDRIIQGKACMKGHEVTFHDNGKIKRFTPAENVEIGGTLWWKGKPIELNEDGKIVLGTPFNDQVIGGVRCPHGREVLLHNNGGIKRAHIAERQTIDGIETDGGHIIEMNAEGRILSKSESPR